MFKNNAIYHIYIYISIKTQNSLSHALSRMLQKNFLNTMAADVQAPCISRSSTARVFTVQDKQFLIPHNKGFQMSVLYPCWEAIKMQVYFYISLNNSVNIANPPALTIVLSWHLPQCVHLCALTDLLNYLLQLSYFCRLYLQASQTLILLVSADTALNEATTGFTYMSGQKRQTDKLRR